MPRSPRYPIASLYFEDHQEAEYFRELAKIRREPSLSGMLMYFVRRGLKADDRDGLLFKAHDTHPDPDAAPSAPKRGKVP